MPIKDPIRYREYMKAYQKAHKEELKEYMKAYQKAHREENKARCKAYREANKDKNNTRCKTWRESHKDEFRDYQRNWHKAYRKVDVNSYGQSKQSIRTKSYHYLKKYGTKIQGYEIHHCFTYDEPYKFIYCSIELHYKIHAYLREHNIDADSDHYEQIKHLLDDTVVIYGI